MLTMQNSWEVFNPRTPLRPVKEGFATSTLKGTHFIKIITRLGILGLIKTSVNRTQSKIFFFFLNRFGSGVCFTIRHKQCDDI